MGVSETNGGNADSSARSARKGENRPSSFAISKTGSPPFRGLEKKKRKKKIYGIGVNVGTEGRNRRKPGSKWTQSSVENGGGLKSNKQLVKVTEGKNAESSKADSYLEAVGLGEEGTTHRARSETESFRSVRDSKGKREIRGKKKNTIGFGSLLLRGEEMKGGKKGRFCRRV